MESSVNKPVDVTLVIASGGIKPFSAIPIVWYLEKIGCRIKTIIGSSGGAIVGGGLSLGLSASEMAQLYRQSVSQGLFRNINFIDIANFFGIGGRRVERPMGFFSPKPLQEQFRRFAGDIDLSEIPTDFHVQVTDFYTGEGRLLNKGTAWKVVYGSCAMYPFFPPIEVDGHVIVDGGFSAELPVLEIEGISKNPVIALRFPETKIRQNRGFAGSFMHLITSSSRQKEIYQHRWTAAQTDLDVYYLNIPFSDWVWMWEVERLEWIWNTGLEALVNNAGPVAEFLGLEPIHNFRPPMPEH